MTASEALPRLYGELAEWWPLLSSPEDYAEEAEFYRRTMIAAAARPLKEVLELGSGGGNNASHLKRHFHMTLVDISPRMLAVSQALNPECNHLNGDMRSVRLGRQFDAVFIHDAIDYMTTEADLEQAIRTAYHHCRPGGVALFAPDHTRETFQPGTDHGGYEHGARGLRYLEWTWDPDPLDTQYIFLMVYALREGDRAARVVQDQHLCGLFSQGNWLRIIEEAGFKALTVPFEHSEPGLSGNPLFLGIK